MNYREFDSGNIAAEIEDTKKYLLRHRYLFGENNYLQKDNLLNTFCLSSEPIRGDNGEISEIIKFVFTYEFTLKEIEKIKKELKTDLKDFDFIEAEWF